MPILCVPTTYYDAKNNIDLTKNENKILNFIERQTFPFGKNEDTLTSGRIAFYTKIRKDAVKKILKMLLKKTDLVKREPHEKYEYRYIIDEKYLDVSVFGNPSEIVFSSEQKSPITTNCGTYNTNTTSNIKDKQYKIQIEELTHMVNKLLPDGVIYGDGTAYPKFNNETLPPKFNNEQTLPQNIIKNDVLYEQNQDVLYEQNNLEPIGDNFEDFNDIPLDDYTTMLDTLNKKKELSKSQSPKIPKIENHILLKSELKQYQNEIQTLLTRFKTKPDDITVIEKILNNTSGIRNPIAYASKLIYKAKQSTLFDIVTNHASFVEFEPTPVEKEKKLPIPKDLLPNLIRFFENKDTWKVEYKSWYKANLTFFKQEKIKFTENNQFEYQNTVFKYKDGQVDIIDSP